MVKISKDTNLRDCNFISVRLRHASLGGGITTIGQLLTAPRNTLLTLRNFGKQTMVEVDQLRNEIELEEENDYQEANTESETPAGDLMGTATAALSSSTALMEMHAINVNNPARVILTKRGANMLNLYKMSFPGNLERFLSDAWLPADRNGHYQGGDVFEGQMSDVMRIFGPHLNTGSEALFEGNIIKCLTD